MHGEVCLRERLTLRHVRHDVDFGRVRVVSTPLAALTLAAANPCMDSASPATSEALAAASASKVASIVPLTAAGASAGSRRHASVFSRLQARQEKAQVATISAMLRLHSPAAARCGQSRSRSRQPTDSHW